MFIETCPNNLTPKDDNNANLDCDDNGLDHGYDHDHHTGENVKDLSNIRTY